MGAVIGVARAVRVRLMGAMIAIAVVLGTAGGLATSLAESGTRARTAVDRMLESTRLPDVFMAGAALSDAEMQQVRAVPGVAGASQLSGLAMFVPEEDFVNVSVPLDDRYGTDVDVVRIVRGRAADPDSADEMVLGEEVAETLGADVGDVVRFVSFSPEQVVRFLEEEPAGDEEPEFLGPTVAIEVVGITRHPADLTSDDPLGYFVTLPPGFYRQYAGRIGEFYPFVVADLGHAPTAAERDAATVAMQAIGGDDAFFEETGEQTGGALEATLRFVGLSMIVLAAAIAAAGLVVGGLLVFRTVLRVSDETASLGAIGMTPNERAAVVASAIAPSAIGAGLLAFVVAVASTRYVPFGLARRAEIDGGLRLEAFPLVIGTGATVLVTGSITVALAAREVRRQRSTRVHRSAVLDRLARAGLPIGPLVGVDLALGSSRAGKPATNRFASIAVAVGTAACIGAVVLSSSIAHLESTPAAYGWTWDFVVHDEAVDMLVDDPEVAELGVVRAGPLLLNGTPVMTRGMTAIKGGAPLEVVNGRPPGAGEIVLGRRTMADLAVGIGDIVSAEGAESTRDLRVVGEAVFAGIVDVPEAARGAAIGGDDFEHIGPFDTAGAGAVVGLADGVDHDRFAARIEQQVGEPPGTIEEPMELARLREIEAFPWILVGFLLTGGLVALVHAVVVTGQRRRRDLAVLRSMGLRPLGVLCAVSVQTLVLAGIGGVIGLPLGVAAGQTLWRALARSLGVVVVVDVPWPAILLSAAVGLTLAGLFALLPARLAARRSIAVVLRAE